jgi:hypothetical protein
MHTATVGWVDSVCLTKVTKLAGKKEKETFFTIWTSWVSKDTEFNVDFKNINPYCNLEIRFSGKTFNVNFVTKVSLYF